jgi:hypothetical protein
LHNAHITQKLTPDGKKKLLNFAVGMLQRIDVDPGFFPSILFSDEATFHQSGKLNRHNARTWRSQNPHIHRQVV